MKKGDVLVALLLAAGAAACFPPAPAAAPSQPAAAPLETHDVADLVNRHRRKIGCPPLRWTAPVAAVAQAHSADMVRRNFFSHINPDGLNPFQRLDRAEVRFVKAAENIAAGQTLSQQVFDSWMSSTGHRRNIEDCSLREHGIGLERGAPSFKYGVVLNAWTHVFVRLAD